MKAFNKIKKKYAEVMTLNRLWICSCAAFTCTLVASLLQNLGLAVTFLVIFLALMYSSRIT